MLRGLKMDWPFLPLVLDASTIVPALGYEINKFSSSNFNDAFIDV